MNCFKFQFSPQQLLISMPNICIQIDFSNENGWFFTGNFLCIYLKANISILLNGRFITPLAFSKIHQTFHTLPMRQRYRDVLCIQNMRGCAILDICPKHILNPTCEIVFASNLFLSCPIVSKCCTEHSSISGMLCATFQNEWTTDTDVMDK